MYNTSKRLILEVGCGKWPWPILRLACLSNPKRYKPVVTSLMNEYANLLPNDQFICLDKDVNLIREGQNRQEELLEDHKILKQVPITFMVGDGRKLSFADKSVDCVILSDVLSAPTPGTTPVSEPYPPEICISSGAKWKMIKETLRVLKDGGTFIIGICLTPCYATNTIQRIEKELIKKGRIQLLKQHGKFVGESDDWHLFHAAFQKNPGPPIKSAKLIPWTPAQKRYIEQYAAATWW